MSCRPCGGQSSAATQAFSTALLDSGCCGGPYIGGCSASAFSGSSDLSSVVPKPVLVNAIIHIERNQ